MGENPAGEEQQQEWLLQDNLGYVALLGTGIVVVQPFLTATRLDPSATVCVIAFAAAIPLLAALALVNRQETFLRRRWNALLVTVAKPVAQVAAFVGLVAAFWHIAWFGGVVFLVGGVLAFVVYASGYRWLEHHR